MAQRSLILSKDCNTTRIADSYGRSQGSYTASVGRSGRRAEGKNTQLLHVNTREVMETLFFYGYASPGWAFSVALQ